ncbi:DUF397 domain-containing protein [Streptomyces griseorubiginosus]|uniref:DUF397 domain-containing protein n=1 Tax=Streptomyces griseorubiginosus TaxID=67304 RepID=UPI0036834FCD
MRHRFPPTPANTSTSASLRPDSPSAAGGRTHGRRSPRVSDSENGTAGPRLAFTPAGWTAFVSQT